MKAELLMLHYESLAVIVARSVVPDELPQIDPDDIVQAARIGLHKGINGFDPQRGTKFETYVGTRMKYAIRDWMRAQDNMSEWSLRNIRLMSKATAEHVAKHKVVPTNVQLAETLGWRENTVAALENHRMNGRPVTITDFAVRNAMKEETLNEVFEARKADERAQNTRHREDLEWLIRHVSPQYRPMFKMRFYLNESPSNIGYVFDIRENMVSQIIAQEIKRIKPDVESQMKARN